MTLRKTTPHLPKGRPTKYDPIFCQKVIDIGRLGQLRCHITSKLGVTMTTIVQWEAKYPLFKSAMEQSAELAEAWWFDQAQNRATQGSDKMICFILERKFNYNQQSDINLDINTDTDIVDFSLIKPT